MVARRGYHTFKDGQEVIEPWCPADPIPDDAVVFSYRKVRLAGFRF